MTKQMPLRKPLPVGRSYEQVLNHYLVEKDLAAQLRASSRAQRSEMFGRMYDELFAKVPDHPRLTRRHDETQTEQANLSKWRLLQRFIKPSSRLLEFAPGDCLFALQMAGRVRRIYAVDISTQHDNRVSFPENLEFIIYDGYTLDDILDGGVDVAFSDQLLEHLHPDDTLLHLALIFDKLASGGVYVVQTPHRYSGPHDVSQYFSDIPEGFHLKEWTFRELGALAFDAGFSKLRCYWKAKGITVRIPYLFYAFWEPVLGVLPQYLRRSAAKYSLPTLYMALYK